MTTQNTPKQIGRFRLLEKIGQGSYGKVYLAEDPVLSRKVAIKLITKQTGDQYELDYYLGEGRNVANLRHPNIIDLYEAGAVNRYPYLVFEYVQGKTLKDVLSANDIKNRTTALRYMQQIIDALAYAHSQGIMHLDMSPNNVMIDNNGDARIMDFGLSRMADGAQVRSHSVAGTPRYLSPEHLQSQMLTMQSEVFTMGLIFYEVMTGKRLVDASSLDAVYQQIVNVDFDFSALEQHDIPANVSAIIFKCLKADPKQRYANAAELRKALETALEDIAKQERELKDHGTIDFMLRRIRRNQDFPALSTNLMTINKLTADNSNASADALASVILRDYSITNKLLKLANSSFYGNFKGNVNSVSRAISILGFDQVKIACNSLILFDSLGKKEHIPLLRDSLIHSFVSGLIARHLVLKLEHIDAEEAFICGMFHTLGNILTVYYFPEEYSAIQVATYEEEMSKEMAEEEILGIRLYAIGQTIAREWHFPDTVIQSMQPISGEVLTADDVNDSTIVLNRFAGIASQLASLHELEDAEIQTQLQLMTDILQAVLKVNEDILLALFNAAIDKYKSMNKILGLKAESSQYLHDATTWLDNWYANKQQAVNA